MFTSAIRKVAHSISPENRKRVHSLADRALRPLGSVSRAASATPLVALTFDDGPDADITPRLLDLLSSRATQATFFVLTDRAERHPDLIRRMVRDGHEVALHCDRHDRLTKLPRAEVRQRIEAAKRKLEALTGQPVTRFRTPFGSQDVSTILTARALGLELVVWGPIAEDWIEQTPEQAATRLLDQVRGGEIALLHDGLEVPEGEPVPTFDRVEMVRLILDGLSERGLAATSVAGLSRSASLAKTFWVRP